MTSRPTSTRRYSTSSVGSPLGSWICTRTRTDFMLTEADRNPAPKHFKWVHIFPWIRSPIRTWLFNLLKHNILLYNLRAKAESYIRKKELCGGKVVLLFLLLVLTKNLKMAKFWNPDSEIKLKYVIQDRIKTSRILLTILSTRSRSFMYRYSVFLAFVPYRTYLLTCT